MIWGTMRAQIVLGLTVLLLAGVLAQAAAGQDDYTEGGYGEGGDYGERPQLVLGTVLQRELEPSETYQMRDGGIESVRFWIPWSEVEAERGKFEWRDVDDTVRKIARAGLTPLPFLFGTPAWAAKVDGYQCAFWECASFGPASPETRAAFARFSRRAVQRYGPDGVFWRTNWWLPYRPIRVWQLWNEPNLLSFWRPAVYPSGYAELVRVAAEEIHDEDPDAEVVLGGLSGNRTTSKRISTTAFLKYFYATPGIASSFEGIALHPYDANRRGVFKQIDSGLKVAMENDPDFDLWITELGWASRGAGHWVLIKSLKGQARMLRRVFGRLIRRAQDWDLRGIYWYAWRDTEVGKAVCGWCGAAGLVDRNGVPKPAFAELEQLARQLP